MGGSLSSSAKQLAQRVTPGAQRKLKPFSPQEIEALNRLAEQDQARMRELPTMEELNAKDDTLDGLLNKLGGAIAGRDLSPDEPPQASPSGRQMPPARPSQAVRAAAVAARKSTLSADDQPGRLQSYIIREILEARTAAASEQKALDLEPYIKMYGADAGELGTLMEHACLPAVGKVATFGHQYAFARPPAWWLRGGPSGAQFLSEPTEELRRRLMGDPGPGPGAGVAPGSGAEGGVAAGDVGGGAATGNRSGGRGVAVAAEAQGPGRG